MLKQNVSTSTISTDSTVLLANRIRRRAIKMIHRAKSSHVGSVFSAVDILAYLYEKVLRVDPAHPDWVDRDRFVLSKGHASAGLYAVLAERGFFPDSWLDGFCQVGGLLAAPATHIGVPGVEASTGSLGHGLPIACGMALVAKRENRPYRVFTMLSDGECDEGSTWEAVLFAPFHHLDNLVTIVDYNKIQSLGSVKEVLDLESLSDKWRAFGWSVREVDGHDFTQIENAFQNIPAEPGRPACIIAHTIKGKGVSFMENKLLWHYRSPDEGELRRALAELGEAS
jgi:transketolase